MNRFMSSRFFRCSSNNFPNILKLAIGLSEGAIWTKGKTDACLSSESVAETLKFTEQAKNFDASCVLRRDGIVSFSEDPNIPKLNRRIPTYDKELFEEDYEKAEKLKKKAELLRATLGDKFGEEIEEEKDPEMRDSDEEIDSDEEKLWIKCFAGSVYEIQQNLLNILLIHNYRPPVLPCYW